MRQLSLARQLSAAEAAEEEIRRASRPLFVLGVLGCLSVFYGEFRGLAVGGLLLVLAALLRFKRSRTAALLIPLGWFGALVAFLASHPGLPTWFQRLDALFFVLATVSGCLAVRATFRYRRAVGSTSLM